VYSYLSAVISVTELSYSCSDIVIYNFFCRNIILCCTFRIIEMEYINFCRYLQFNPEELIYAELYYAANRRRTFHVYCFEFRAGVLGIRKDARVSRLWCFYGFFLLSLRKRQDICLVL